MMRRYLSALLVAFCLSLLFCYLLIPLLRKWKAGQNILSYVKEHKNKSGTPTMGGIAFLSAAILISLFFISKRDKDALLCIVIGLAYMAVGLLDDYMKKKQKQNLGLRAWQKLLFQTGIAIFAGIYCYRSGHTSILLPFFKKEISIGWWILPLSIFVFIATVNAVNLTDGLDGLAAGVSVPYFAFFGVLLALQKTQGLSLLSFCLTGSLLAYLFFNVSPASVFMGDTGSLALGGFASAIALLSGNVLHILLVGACFVFSVISVVVQVIYYKATGGKRVFLMAPVHHHFQKKGYSESKISYAYFAITLFLGLICLL